ncbi:hypothetical protein AALO_G00302340 [Alosa alosa]|uniref:Uncharacterized protein n=1 Tax=Alosa alosa TaxID=278164 RepID=A0AAV6FET0_9TELE|nr:hypothetical protein AALO_G00302340 [Alosa alosa]
MTEFLVPLEGQTKWPIGFYDGTSPRPGSVGSPLTQAALSSSPGGGHHAGQVSPSQSPHLHHQVSLNHL